MDESEKLTALKKAYAEIILNTAKEAAARIMVSERKAIRFQTELSATKEEALRMLVRLKQILDSKVSETEMVSLNKQKKIEELEAQLEEAEDIVRDLRAELQEVQDELERLTNNKRQHLEEPNLTGNSIVHERIPPLNRISALGSISPLSCSQPEVVITTHGMNSTLNGAFQGVVCNSTNKFSKNNGCVRDPDDFASIVMRSKEPELFRNGCTQRIRAFERNLLGEKACFSGQTDDVKIGTLRRGDEEGKGMRQTPLPGTDSICEVVKKANILEVVQTDGESIQLPAFKSLSWKRKRATRYNKRKTSSSRNLTDEAMETCAAADLYCSEVLSVDNTDKSRKSSKANEIDVETDMGISLAPNVSSETTGIIIRVEGVNEGDVPFIKPCSVLVRKHDDKEVLDKSDLTSQESLSAESLDAPACKTDVELVKESVNDVDLKDSDLNGEVPFQSPNSRLIKYTFQRKRKKESLNSPDGHSSLDETISERETGEKGSELLESQKSCLRTGSSQSNRRLAQVARQLISLSEKKW